MSSKNVYINVKLEVKEACLRWGIFAKTNIVETRTAEILDLVETAQ